MPLKANLEIDVGQKTFSDGLLPELIVALRRSRPGDLMAVVTSKSNLSADFEAWCRFTRNSLVEFDRRGRTLPICDPMRRGDAGAGGRPGRRLAPLAVHELRLQPSVQLLLRAILAKG